MNIATRNLLIALALIMGLGAGSASAAQGEERWDVEPVPGGFEVTWTSPEVLPLTSDRPEILLDGLTVGPASVSPGGRRYSAVVTGDQAPDVDELELRLSGRRLDEPEPRSVFPVDSPWVLPSPDLTELGFDPGRKGPYAIRTDDYSAADWKFPGLRQSLETVGHVVAPSKPAVAARGPLVLFLHGRHETCFRKLPKPRTRGTWPCPAGMRPIPSQLGYDYLQRTLASQGFVTVSIAANGINAQDGRLGDGGANARAAAVRRHLDLWSRWVSTGKRRADLSRVVLIGHSRGGEGVNRASSSIPASAPYRIVGQVLLAPTDFARQSAPYIPTVTVLPYCDGDVLDLQGQAYTDASIGLTPGDDSLKSSVIVFGANHNFFNSEWTPGISQARSNDDVWAPPKSLCGSRGKTRLNASEQRRVGESYVAGAVRLMTGIDDRARPLFDGSSVEVGTVEKATVISHSVGGGKLTLVAGRQAKLPTRSGNGIFICRGYAGPTPGTCAPGASFDAAPHWPYADEGRLPTRPALAMSWKGEGRTATLRFSRDLDLREAGSLDLRTVVDPETRIARVGIRLTDRDGNRLELRPSRGGRVEGMPTGFMTPGRWLARNLRAPVPATAPGSFDLARVSSISIVGLAKPGCGARCPKISRIRVLDVSAVPREPAASSLGGRLPTVMVRPMTRREGGPGVHSIRLPFEIRGKVSDPGTRFRVVTIDERGLRGPRSSTVSLGPDQKSGSIEVRYRGDRGYDRDQRIRVEIYPIRGVLPATAATTVVVRNDDPKPTLAVVPLERTIRSGETARWRVSLDRPVSRAAALSARFAAVPDPPQLRIGDLPAGWFERWILGPGDLSPDTPLSRVRYPIRLGGISHRQSRIISVPTRRFSGSARQVRLRVVADGISRSLAPAIRVLPR